MLESSISRLWSELKNALTHGMYTHIDIHHSEVVWWRPRPVSCMHPLTRTFILYKLKIHIPACKYICERMRNHWWRCEYSVKIGGQDVSTQVFGEDVRTQWRFEVKMWALSEDLRWRCAYSVKIWGEDVSTQWIFEVKMWVLSEDLRWRCEYSGHSCMHRHMHTSKHARSFAQFREWDVAFCVSANLLVHLLSLYAYSLVQCACA